MSRLRIVPAALALTLYGVSDGGVRAADRPNVILIYADDLGWGDLGCYGHKVFKTPNIDRLAAGGARLTNFYSAYPYCAPSRAALQTGRYPVRFGLTRNPCPDEGVNDVGMPASEITLGEAFRAAGYATACIGKWHLGHKPEFHPLRHGYDEYFGILYSNDMHPVELWDGPRVVEYPVVQATLTRRYTERAAAFIESNKDRPFFLYLPHAMPHKPLACSEAFYGKSGTGLYGDVIAELDWSVGQIVALLGRLGLDRRTLVLFTSDNGPWYGGSTGGLRGMKSRTWEGGIRVPLIASWPGRIPAGHVSDEPAGIVDLFVTTLRAAGIEPPHDRELDGRDILPLLTSAASSPHEALFSFQGNRLATVRSGRWKLHLIRPGPPDRQWQPDEPWVDKRRPDGVRILAPFEQAHPSQYPGILTGDPVQDIGLFDLQADPTEQHNVAALQPDVVRRLRKLAEDFQAGLSANSRPSGR